MSRRSACLSGFLALICWVAVAVPASAQHFKQIAGSLSQIAVGRTEVWGIDASNHTYRFIPGTKKFLLMPVSLTQVAVGGGTLLQNDEVWGVNASGQIYRFNFHTKTLAQVPGVLSQIAVGEGNQDKCHPYEVWGIDPNLHVYRYNYCTSQWTQGDIALTPPLTHIATCGGSTWGLDEYAQIWEYDPTGIGAWNQIPGSLQQLTVGVNDVWGLDGNGGDWRYDPIDGGFISYILMEPLTQIAAGGNGVWAIDSFGNLYRFSKDGPLSDDGYFFHQMYVSLTPLTQIAVGSGGGVWGVDSSNRIFTFVRP